MKNLTIEQFKSLKILIESVAKARRFRLFSESEWQIIKNALLTLKIPYKVNTKLVRGLDYYNHICFI